MPSRVEALAIGATICAVGFFFLSVVSDGPEDAETARRLALAPGTVDSPAGSVRQERSDGGGLVVSGSGWNSAREERNTRGESSAFLPGRSREGGERRDGDAVSGARGAGPQVIQPGNAGRLHDASASQGRVDGASHRATVAAERRDGLVSFLGEERKKAGSSRRGADGSSSGVRSGEEGVDVDLEPLDGEEDDVLLSIPLDGDTAAEDRGEALAASNVTVDAETDRVDFARDSVLAFEAEDVLRPDAGSISLLIEPNWSGSDTGDNSIMQILGSESGEGQVWLRRRGKYLRFEWADEQGQQQGVNVNIREWEAGAPHTVTTTWNSDTLTIYVDGKKVRSARSGGQFTVPQDPTLLVGSYGPNVAGADAKLSDIKFYGRELGPHEIPRVPTPAKTE